MNGDTRDDVAAIAPLGDPVRRRLYDFVVARGVPVDRDTAAAGAGIGRPLAAFHLDRLAAAGLLDIEYRRRSGRSGPGAGRPAKFYRRADRDIALSLPPRRYELAAEILAEGVERRPALEAGVIEAARDRGARRAREATAREATARKAAAEADPSAGLEAVLAADGYEPFGAADGTLRLRNCPFDALVAGHRELACSMNLAYLEALAAGIDTAGLHPVARPEAGLCCVAFAPDPVPAHGRVDDDAPEGLSA